MKKIWIGAGLVCVLSLAGCGGGEKTEAPKNGGKHTGSRRRRVRHAG